MFRYVIGRSVSSSAFSYVGALRAEEASLWKSSFGDFASGDNQSALQFLLAVGIKRKDA